MGIIKENVLRDSNKMSKIHGLDDVEEEFRDATVTEARPSGSAQNSSPYVGKCSFERHQIIHQCTP